MQTKKFHCSTLAVHHRVNSWARRPLSESKLRASSPHSTRCSPHRDSATQNCIRATQIKTASRSDKSEPRSYQSQCQVSSSQRLGRVRAAMPTVAQPTPLDTACPYRSLGLPCALPVSSRLVSRPPARPPAAAPLASAVSPRAALEPPPPARLLNASRAVRLELRQLRPVRPRVTLRPVPEAARSAADQSPRRWPEVSVPHPPPG